MLTINWLEQKYQLERGVTIEDLQDLLLKDGMSLVLVDDNGNETILGRYMRTVEDKLQANWTTDNDIEEKWNVLKSALCKGARLELGYNKKRHPETTS